MNTQMDKLSCFDDGVLGTILSFLPIKEGVASSLLSKRWINVYKYISTLHFDSKLLGDSTNKRMEIIKKALKAVENARVIRLQWGDIQEEDAVEEWNQLYFLLERFVARIEELYVSMVRIDDIRLFDIKIWKHLVKLHLEAGFYIDLSTSLSFTMPFLKVVHLVRVEFTSDESLSYFFEGCPNIVEFYSFNTVWKHISHLRINNPKLERLCLLFQGFHSILSGGCIDKVIEIICPSLNDLSYFDLWPSELSLSSDCMRRVKMGFQLLTGQHFNAILRAVSQASQIDLLALMGLIEVDSFKSCDVPQFNNQTTLNLWVPKMKISYFCGLVSNLMNSSLKSLYIGNVKVGESAIQINEEDGEIATTFSKLLSRFLELTDELQSYKELCDTLEVTCGFTLCIELVSQVSDVPGNELDALLGERITKAVEECEEEKNSVAAQMAELKKILAHKFKDSIT